jgi:chemotaxis protein MotB
MTDDMFEQSTPAPDSAPWLISMTDLVSILLCFFIMIFSMSTLELDKWRKLTGMPGTAQPTAVERPAPPPAATPEIPRVEAPLGADLGYLGNVLAGKLAADPLLHGALVARSPDGLVIALPSRLLFASGSDALSAPARAALDRLGDVLRALDNRIEVRGQTDPAPIETADFPSNWELSLARAEAVRAALLHSGYDGPLLAFGQADARFADLPVALPEAERLRLARRVDLVIRPTAVRRAR